MSLRKKMYGVFRLIGVCLPLIALVEDSLRVAIVKISFTEKLYFENDVFSFHVEEGFLSFPFIYGTTQCKYFKLTCCVNEKFDVDFGVEAETI